MATTSHKLPSFSRKEAANSLRGHTGRLRKFLREANAPATALSHLAGIEQAGAILARDPSEEVAADKGKGVPIGSRVSDHFQENGRYLSDQGRAFLFNLFDGGHSVRAAAALVGISVKSAASHRATWLRRHPSPFMDPGSS